MVKVIIKKSSNPKKKLMAVFSDDSGKKIKTTHFGASSSSDYTLHGDEKRKRNYLQRHRTAENWQDYKSAGSLSRYVLWELKSKSSAIKAYKRRFNLK